MERGARPEVRSRRLREGSRMSATSDDYWKQEFEKRIAGIKPLSPHADKRDTPRREFERRTHVLVSGPPQSYRILNISAGGAAILSERLLEPGTRLMLSLKSSIFVEIEVVGCDMVERDEASMEFAYSTRCRFSNEQDGFMAFVLLADG